MATVTCAQCGKVFERKPSQINDKNYCSHTCASKAKETQMEFVCAQCGKTRKKSLSRVRDNNYCSVACRAKSTETKVSVICAWCGKICKKVRGRVKDSNYCSTACYGKAKEIKVEVTCECCGKLFFKKPSGLREKNYCSHMCYSKAKETRIEVVCAQCGTLFKRHPSRLRAKNYCSKLCAMYMCINYISKLELDVSKHLCEKYAQLDFLFNDRKAIRMELDILVNKLGIAFELNGPTHYLPIYGEKSLKKVQKRDRLRCLTCYTNSIDLYSINVSTEGYSKQQLSNTLTFICTIIDERLAHAAAQSIPPYHCYSNTAGLTYIPHPSHMPMELAV